MSEEAGNGAGSARPERGSGAGRARPQHTPPLRSRVVTAMVLLCAGVLLGACLAVYAGTRQSLLNNLDATLWTVAQTEVASALDGPAGTTHLHLGEPIPLQFSQAGDYFKVGQIQDAAGKVLAVTPHASGTPLTTDAAAFARALEGVPTITDAAGLRVIYFPMAAGPQSLVAVIALSRQPVDRTLSALALLLGAVWLAGLGASYIAGTRMARRLVAPLEDIAGTAATVDAGEPGIRIPEDLPDAELVTVARTINGMLDRLESALDARSRLLASQRRFMADASHELRTPLNNMRGTIEVALRRKRSDQEYREALDVCLREVGRMSRLVSEMLNLERAEAGQMAQARDLVDVRDVAEDAVRACRARADARQLSVVLRDDGPALAEGDAGRLRQALDNLLDNAVRYAPPGSEITVSVEAAGSAIEVRVSDHGIGLSEEDRSRVFDRFYRADPSRDRASGGLGLGLAITRAILEAHGGSVDVRSLPDEGATFVLRLPAVAASVR